MSELPPDTLNEIGVLRRREIEARILMPVLERLGAEFGEERVVALARDVIIDVAREQGRELARQMGGDALDRCRALEKEEGDRISGHVESTPARSVQRSSESYAAMYRSSASASRRALSSPRFSP